MFWKKTLAFESLVVLAYPLIYLVAPNLPVWLFEKELWLSPHGYFNLECLLVGILALFLPRALAFVLLMLEMVASFVYLICFTCQFSLKTLCSSLHYVSLLPSGRLALALPILVLITLLSGLVAFAVPRLSLHRRGLAAAGLLAAGFLLIACDMADGEISLRPADSYDDCPKMTMSPLTSLARRGRLFRTVEASERAATDREIGSASAAGLGFLSIAPTRRSPNVVLIVVESWGLFRDARLADALDSGYHEPSIQAIYRVQSGTVPFGGLTVPGEARELCHSSIGFGILNLSASKTMRCLPSVFHQHGYEDIAIHGYVGEMFSRKDWYRTIGFDEQWFKPELARAGLPVCNGAFPGICDASVAGWIGHDLLAGDSTRPRFIYWVTLNSHLPVPNHPDLPTDAACSLLPELAASDSLCSWFRLVSALHHSVQELVLQPQSRPTIFILVGDHAPPFADPRLRAMFSNAVVPYVVLTPLSLSN
jgi:hypothetical protein